MDANSSDNPKPRQFTLASIFVLTTLVALVLGLTLPMIRHVIEAAREASRRYPDYSKPFKRLQLGHFNYYRHQSELARVAPQIAWLPPDRAASAYKNATQYCSKSHCCLDSSTVSNIERCNAEQELETNDWLSSRCIGQTLRLAFDPDDVCDVSSGFFLSNWRDLFVQVPAEVVIRPRDKNWILYYDHNGFAGSFEFGLLVP